MRFISENDEAAMHSKVLAGAAKGFAISTVLSVSAAILAQKYSSAFRNLSAPLRVGAVTMPILAGVTIAAEEALLAHERDQHALHDTINTGESEAKPKVEFDLRRFVADHKYHFCVGAWVAGVAGTLAMSYGNPYLTATQKAFHARVYSQGITVAALMATALVTPFGTDKKAEVKLHDEELFKRRLAYEEARYNAKATQ